MGGGGGGGGGCVRDEFNPMYVEYFSLHWFLTEAS